MAKKIAEELMDDEDFEDGDEEGSVYDGVTSSRIILKNFLEKYNGARKNTFDGIDRIAKSALLNTLKDGFGIKGDTDYKTLKKLLDESSIGISLPEDIKVNFDGNNYTDYILLFKDNKTYVVNSKMEEIGTVDKNGFYEAYYPSKVDIDMDAVFYR